MVVERVLRRAAGTVFVMSVLALVALPFAAGAQGPPVPTDKMVVQGSTVQENSPNADAVVLTARMRTSTTEDLTLAVTLECAITTRLTTMGNDSANALGDVKVWVTVDDVPVSVSGSDDGKVTFCDRNDARQTSGFEPNETITTTVSTVGANGFNWVALNTGNGIHTIKVHASLTGTSASRQSEAKAAIGRRTLVVDATHAAPNETLG